MKQNIIFKLSVLLIMGALFGSCTKDDFEPVNMSELNPDEPLENTELDQWLKTTFLDEYNMDVIYRYSRYNHEADRNVTPPRPDAVKPMMTTILEGYINPYRKIAGETFIKTNVPKEWVLFGSTSYDGSNVGYAGTAAGGVRVNLFGINNFSLSPAFVKGRLGVIHHEFIHILNQRFIMPADFQEITKSTYNGNWTSTNADSAHKWGYVSTYASQNPTEDFAETASALLVSGQSWFDNRVRTSSSDAGKKALRAKEQSVVDYFNSSLNIDFRALQKEIQLYIKNTLKDPSVTFPYWINQGLYKTLTVNLDDVMYAQYGSSAAFATVYNQFKEAVYNFNTTARYRLDYIQFRFDTPTSLVVRAAFTATGGTANGTQYFGDYSFTANVNSNTGETTFTKIAQATGTTFNNGNLFLTSFQNTIQKFLTEDAFVADWLPVSTPASLYTKTGGFSQKSAPANYVYGNLGQ